MDASPKRTAKIIEEELATLTEELRKLKSTCECRLHAIHIHPHQRSIYKKCLACSKSVKMSLDSLEWLEEWEKLGRK